MTRFQLCLILLGFLFFGACDQEETPCLGCKEEVDETFANVYFQVLQVGDDTLVRHYDSAGRVWLYYNVCSPEILTVLNETTIVASGGFRTLCQNPSIMLADIEEFELVPFCVPAVPNLVGNFELTNTWLIHYIQTMDTTMSPPCEGSSDISFSNWPDNEVSGVLSLNSFVGTYTEINDSTIQMPASFIVTLSVGTLAQNYFEGLYLQCLEGAAITYSIDNNILTLKNKSQNSVIRAYLRTE